MPLFAEHGTLVASVVTTVTVDKDADAIEVVNVDGVDAIYFTIDGTVPTVEGANTYVLPPSVSSRVVTPPRSGYETDVQLISVGAPNYSVLANVLG